MASIAHLCDKVVTVKRESNVSDGAGGWTTSFTQVGDTVMGRRSPAGGNERAVAGELAAQVTHAWYFDGTPDIKVRDELHSDEQLRYEVLVVLTPSRADFIKVLVKEVQIGAVT